MSGATKDRCSECRERIIRTGFGWITHGFLCSRIGLAPDASAEGIERADRLRADLRAASSQGKDGR